MRPSPSTSSLVRRASGFTALIALAGLAACSQQSPVPLCENCEAWDELTAGLGRFPAPHPGNPKVIAYSTVDKTPGAPDANRESDEDVWLTWINDLTSPDPATDPVWQLTGDELGPGDNFYPRWSPSGTQIAFVHTSPGGRFEVWMLPVLPPTGPGEAPSTGTAELVGPGRDPAWASEDRLVFTRADKLYAVDVTAARSAGTPVQLSYNPPVYAASDEFIDRHPDFADGGAIFDTIGRENVANVFLKAFEVDNSVTPPETLATDAFILFQAPGATPAYPIFEGADTLRTPALLTSLPVGAGGNFVLGVRLDGRFLADSTRETYCDTTITKNVLLQPGATDSLTYYFSVSRGTLRLSSTLSNTTVFWTRSDGLVDSGDFPQSGVLNNAGDTRDWNCILSYDVASGVPTPPSLETFLITATRLGSAPFDTTVVIPPGDTTSVVVYSAGVSTDLRSAQVLEPLRLLSSASGSSRAPNALAGGLPSLRAEGELGMVWRLQLTDNTAVLSELFGREALIQNPVLSPETADGKRYVAYVTNESGTWDLFVQQLAVTGSGPGEQWVVDGAPVHVATPGTLDNLDCRRSVFHPQFAPGADASSLRLVVALANCPDNGFGSLGFDDDPWAIGEVRVWQVSVPTR